MPATANRRRRMRRGLPIQNGHAALSAGDPIYEISESVALLEQAVEANQSQIHEVSQNTSRQIGELAQSTNRQMREMMSGIEKMGAEFRTEIRTLATEFSNSKKTNWPLFLSIVMAGFVFLGAAYSLVELRTHVTLAPIAAKAEISETDRVAIREDISQNRQTNADQTSEITNLRAKFAEVETQFRASDQARNVQFAEQQRMNNILMQLASQGKIQYPAGPFFMPSIAAPPPPSQQ